jgi:hypothetical protein
VLARPKAPPPGRGKVRCASHDFVNAGANEI